MGMGMGMGMGMSGMGMSGMNMGTDSLQSVSSDPNEATIHLSVPDKLAGLILGKGGGNIKELSVRSGCKIRMTNRSEFEDRRVVMSGGIEEVCLAQDMVREVLREAFATEGIPEPPMYTVTMLLRREAVGAVIGSKGAGINALREQTGAKIKVDENGEIVRPCTLEGSVQQVYLAERQIHDIVKEVPVDPNARVRAQSLAAAKRPLMDMSMASGFGMDAKRRRFGQSYSSVAQPLAAPPMEDNPESETRLLIPESSAGLVIGKQGINLKSIRETFSVRLDMMGSDKTPQWPGERLIMLKGMLASRVSSVEAILQFSQKHSQQEQWVGLKFLIPSAAIAHVVGEGGYNLTYFQDYYSVNAQVSNEEVAGDYVVVVEGYIRNVVEAAQQVIYLQDGGQVYPQGQGYDQQQMQDYSNYGNQFGQQQGMQAQMGGYQQAGGYGAIDNGMSQMSQGFVQGGNAFGQQSGMAGCQGGFQQQMNFGQMAQTNMQQQFQQGGFAQGADAAFFGQAAAGNVAGFGMQADMTAANQFGVNPALPQAF
mmetsp:Transcript_49391/g.117523  ORF Transcript_49391/g.117523 Transcript_49391/m.117523 type:complete len:537 (-) Transcript_49391:43-1653(-)